MIKKVMRSRWLVAGMVMAVSTCLVSKAQAGSFTDFESFALGSVNGQGGWSATNANIDQGVVDDGTGNQVWRISNAVTGSSFGDMPFAPRPGGIPSLPLDPTNSMPNEFAGEGSTGATYNRYFTEFDFQSATGAAQAGLSITLSPDNGSGGRQGFVDIEDTGSSLEIITYDVDSSGNFVGPTTISTGLSYTDWHTLGIEVLFMDGVENDVVNYYVNNSLVYSGTSWEQFYAIHQPALQPLGVPVQTTLFRVSGTAATGTLGGGLYIDNVLTEVNNVNAVPEPSSMVLLGIGMVGLAGYGMRRRKQRQAAA
ncbi:PEP-CTERM motif protein [Symmachiella dynata]|uniref:PEP-CTERM motif protein n=1 Tax=Symmachiella dynata TaxID=2527995 RepID=A0A517ZXP7_9PLAN|nr:PEP-CTERM sorting domain-containing protein [Symmachiella dynata]QDU47240.1 PEP-CTERM motif protein [Symmachiella dynata]